MAHAFLLQIGNHRIEINRPISDEVTKSLGIKTEYTPKIMMTEQ